MSGIVSVYAIFGSAEEAEHIGRAMVAEDRAACVNILGPCRSIYHWQGEVVESTEVAAIFKTTADKADALVEAIAALHSYKVPAIAVWPVAATLPAYARWIADPAKS